MEEFHTDTTQAWLAGCTPRVCWYVHLLQATWRVHHVIILTWPSCRATYATARPRSRLPPPRPAWIYESAGKIIEPQCTWYKQTCASILFYSMSVLYSLRLDRADTQHCRGKVDVDNELPPTCRSLRCSYIRAIPIALLTSTNRLDEVPLVMLARDFAQRMSDTSRRSCNNTSPRSG